MMFLFDTMQFCLLISILALYLNNANTANKIDVLNSHKNKMLSSKKSYIIPNRLQHVIDHLALACIFVSI